MTIVTCAAGVDAGLRFLDIGFAPQGKSFRVPNIPEGIAIVVARLRAAGVVRVVLEAIGPPAQRLIYALCAEGFEVGVVNPKRIKAFRDAEGRRAKTDRLDAELIARFALVMTDAINPLPDAEALALKALAARRRQLVEMISMEKNRLKQACEPMLLESHRKAIAALSLECAQIEAELARRIAEDAERQRTFDILTSIPGIGDRIATLLITDLPELGSRDRKAIASLAGLAPHVSQSGAAPPRAAISGGRPCLRAGLYLAGLVASRCHPSLKLAYKDMRAQGKPAKVAIVAIARKLLVLANALVRDRVAYQKDSMAT
jgi:transposase